MSSGSTRNSRSLWQSYTNLSPRTRLYFGLAAGLTGIIGLAVADKLQEMFPADRKGDRNISQAGSGGQHTPGVPQTPAGK